MKIFGGGKKERKGASDPGSPENLSTAPLTLEERLGPVGSGPGANPYGIDYGKAQAAFTGRHVDFQKRAERMEGLALIAFVVALVAVGGLVVLSLRSAVSVQVVEAPVQGPLRYIGEAKVLSAPEPRYMLKELGQFVTDIRTVYIDPVEQRRMMDRAVRMTQGSATTFLNAIYNDPERNPMRLGRKLQRQVDLISVQQPLEGNTWVVRWKETEVPMTQGVGGVRESTWTGSFTVQIVPPDKVEEIPLNPLGLQVTAMTWTKDNEVLLPSAWSAPSAGGVGQNRPVGSPSPGPVVGDGQAAAQGPSGPGVGTPVSKVPGHSISLPQR